MKIGILEQLQNGVIVPSKAPSIAPFTPFSLLNICFVFSGVNLLSIYENIKIRTHNRIIIFIKSYIKNCMLPPIFPSVLSLLAI